ncbi:hypothetical protein K443DRAFT_453924 [Laccaria amethystina LaAM-08-1]|uniref:Uncharacterized protein n=1 Tax=Laccaria amethystina LaAM-08-1 TaxID=1095629 RepID=A0A0C9Y5R2_9AGAR|nr:hypothetical protein K443DRAFT_453924 [Laccaria amethystina LaAM-08-1]
MSTCGMNKAQGYEILSDTRFFFFYSRDLRATSSLVLRRTGSVRLPLGIIRATSVNV